MASQQTPSNPTFADKVKSTLGTNPESQSGTEPLSGETGQGSAGEPYDQGNAAGEPLSFSAALEKSVGDALGEGNTYQRQGIGTERSKGRQIRRAEKRDKGKEIEKKEG